MTEDSKFKWRREEYRRTADALGRARDMLGRVKYQQIAVPKLARDIVDANPGLLEAMAARQQAAIAELDRRTMEYLTARPAERPTLSARLGYLKHGPGGSGLSGPCDADCGKCALEAKPMDPLDVKYDGLSLRLLLDSEQTRLRTERRCKPLSPAQRAAVSAHWSAELRAKVAAAKERDRNVVRVDLEDEP